MRFLWRRLLLRNWSQCKHSGTEIPLQGVSPPIRLGQRLHNLRSTNRRCKLHGKEHQILQEQGKMDKTELSALPLAALRVGQLL